MKSLIPGALFCFALMGFLPGKSSPEGREYGWKFHPFSYQDTDSKEKKSDKISSINSIKTGQWESSLPEKIDFINTNYLVYLPKDYNSPKLSSFPLIIFLHGRNEAGEDIRKIKLHGLPKMLESDSKFPFIVISPQCPSGTIWNHTDKMHEFLDQVLRIYKIDPKRIYLTGISSGGFGTWSWAMDYPNDFAAIAPVSGTFYKDVNPGLSGMPVWIFHGLLDKDSRIHQDSLCFKQLSQNGNKVRFTVYTKGGHDVWNETYSNPELYSWFLRYSIPD